MFGPIRYRVRRFSNLPITTCESESCDDCSVSRNLHCHYTPGDLLRYLLIICPVIVLGGAGIYNVNAGMLMPWLVILVGYFWFVELRAIRPHCSPGADKENTSTCRPGLSALKIWNCRLEPVMLLSGSILVWGYPIYFMIYRGQTFLSVWGLIGYIFLTVSGVLDVVDVVDTVNGAGALLYIPGGLWGFVVFPAWLFIKGFNTQKVSEEYLEPNV